MVLVVEWMKEGINVMAPSQDCLKKIKTKSLTRQSMRICEQEAVDYESHYL